MQSLFGFLLCMTVGIVFPTMAAEAHTAMAAVLPPEALAPGEQPAPPEETEELESSSRPENPFEESTRPDPYEEMRGKRERMTIYIILTVLFLICLYWWTSGKLHHRIPQ